MKIRMRKKYYIRKIPCYILSLLTLTMTGCTKPPESTEIDGVIVAQSAKESENSNTNEFTGNADVKKVLEEFPSHVSWKFENGDNCLYIDADVVIPDNLYEVYTATADVETWSDEKRKSIWDEFLKERIVSELYPTDVYREEENIPASISLYYTDEELLGQDKSSEFSKKSGEESNVQEKLFCRILEKAGFQIRLEPNTIPGEPWNRYSYNIIQLWQNLPIASGFPTTGMNDIVRTGGNLDLGEEQIIFFDLSNMLNIKEKEICEAFADTDRIQQSLQKAVDAYEIMFSKGIKGVRIELQYLAKVQNQQIVLTPVWRVYFDEEGYYQFLEDNPEERERMSMMCLCISAIDGSIAYGI